MALTSSLQQDNYILEYWNDIQTDKVAVSKKIYKTYKKVVQDIENPGR